MKLIRAKELKKAHAYCKRIKNKNKKRYAYAYLNHRQGNSVEPIITDLSQMAAQEVRMTIQEIELKKEK